ncbi:hypothetical protein ABKN59_000791 [Abortiporus biennis]
MHRPNSAANSYSFLSSNPPDIRHDNQYNQFQQLSFPNYDASISIPFPQNSLSHVSRPQSLSPRPPPSQNLYQRPPRFQIMAQLTPQRSYPRTLPQDFLDDPAFSTDPRANPYFTMTSAEQIFPVNSSALNFQHPSFTPDPHIRQGSTREHPVATQRFSLPSQSPRLPPRFAASGPPPPQPATPRPLVHNDAHKPFSQPLPPRFRNAAALNSSSQSLRSQTSFLQPSNSSHTVWTPSLTPSSLSSGSSSSSPAPYTPPNTNPSTPSPPVNTPSSSRTPPVPPVSVVCPIAPATHAVRRKPPPPVDKMVSASTAAPPQYTPVAERPVLITSISAPEVRPPPIPVNTPSRPATVPVPSISPTHGSAHSTDGAEPIVSPSGPPPQRQRSRKSSIVAPPKDLDKIDELDETDPLGFAWHTQGPYDAIKKSTENADGGSDESISVKSVKSLVRSLSEKERKKSQRKSPPSDEPSGSFGVEPGQIFPGFTSYNIPAPNQQPRYPHAHIRRQNSSQKLQPGGPRPPKSRSPSIEQIAIGSTTKSSHSQSQSEQEKSIPGGSEHRQPHDTIVEHEHAREPSQLVTTRSTSSLNRSSRSDLETTSAASRNNSSHPDPPTIIAPLSDAGQLQSQMTSTLPMHEPSRPGQLPHRRTPSGQIHQHRQNRTVIAAPQASQQGHDQPIPLQPESIAVQRPEASGNTPYVDSQSITSQSQGTMPPPSTPVALAAGTSGVGRTHAQAEQPQSQLRPNPAYQEPGLDDKAQPERHPGIRHEQYNEKTTQPEVPSRSDRGPLPQSHSRDPVALTSLNTDVSPTELAYSLPSPLQNPHEDVPRHHHSILRRDTSLQRQQSSAHYNLSRNDSWSQRVRFDDDVSDVATIGSHYPRSAYNVPLQQRPPPLNGPTSAPVQQQAPRTPPPPPYDSQNLPPVQSGKFSPYQRPPRPQSPPGLVVLHPPPQTPPPESQPSRPDIQLPPRSNQQTQQHLKPYQPHYLPKRLVMPTPLQPLQPLPPQPTASYGSSGSSSESLGYSAGYHMDRQPSRPYNNNPSNQYTYPGEQHPHRPQINTHPVVISSSSLSSSSSTSKRAQDIPISHGRNLLRKKVAAKDKEGSQAPGHDMFVEPLKQQQQMMSGRMGYTPSNSTAAMFASRVVVGDLVSDEYGPIGGIGLKPYEMSTLPPPVKEKSGKKLSKRR